MLCPSCLRHSLCADLLILLFTFCTDIIYQSYRMPTMTWHISHNIMLFNRDNSPSIMHYQFVKKVEKCHTIILYSGFIQRLSQIQEHSRTFWGVKQHLFSRTCQVAYWECDTRTVNNINLQEMLTFDKRASWEVRVFDTMRWEARVLETKRYRRSRAYVVQWKKHLQWSVSVQCQS